MALSTSSESSSMAVERSRLIERQPKMPLLQCRSAKICAAMWEALSSCQPLPLLISKHDSRCDRTLSWMRTTSSLCPCRHEAAQGVMASFTCQSMDSRTTIMNLNAWCFLSLHFPRGPFCLVHIKCIWKMHKLMTLNEIAPIWFSFEVYRNKVLFQSISNTEQLYKVLQFAYTSRCSLPVARIVSRKEKCIEGISWQRINVTLWIIDNSLPTEDKL